MQVWLRLPNGQVYDPALVAGIGGALVAGSSPQAFNYTLLDASGNVIYTSTATFPSVGAAQLGAITASVATLT